MERRLFLKLAGAFALSLGRVAARGMETTLLTAPLELRGVWPGTSLEAASRVLPRIRQACLSGVRLVSDRQPDHLIIDDHAEGPPAIWLHDDLPQTAWIIVDVGPNDWCKLAYQFGHELGHVLCNSWEASAKPRPPSQWLEESLVEAFSIRGLGRLAKSWREDPPFAGDAGFGTSVQSYRESLIASYRREALLKPAPGPATWFRADRALLESGAAAPKGVAVLHVLDVLESDGACVEDLGAVNRWSSRSGAPLEEYLKLWEKSCREVGASGRLPARLGSLFGVN
jgi:hypothetical protein